MPTTTETDARSRWAADLRVARARTGRTQAQVGAVVGIAGPTIAKAEDGRGSVHTYDRLARHYRITLTLGHLPDELAAAG